MATNAFDSRLCKALKLIPVSGPPRPVPVMWRRLCLQWLLFWASFLGGKGPTVRPGRSPRSWRVVCFTVHWSLR